MFRSFLLTVCLIAASSSLPAAIIWSNGTFNDQGGNILTEFYSAEDFVLSAPATINRITFWTLEDSSAVPSPYFGTFLYAIFLDATGTPPSNNATLSSGLISPVRTIVGTSVGLDVYENVINFGSPISLAAGTYWLGLHNGPLSNDNNAGAIVDIYWAWTNLNVVNTPTFRGHELALPTGAPPFLWTTNTQEHAFLIESFTTAVPEPSSLFLAGGGILLAAIRRYRK